MYFLLSLYWAQHICRFRGSKDRGLHGVFAEYSGSIHGVFICIGYVSVMYRLCIGYVSEQIRCKKVTKIAFFRQKIWWCQWILVPLQAKVGNGVSIKTIGVNWGVNSCQFKDIFWNKNTPSVRATKINKNQGDYFVWVERMRNAH